MTSLGLEQDIECGALGCFGIMSGRLKEQPMRASSTLLAAARFSSLSSPFPVRRRSIVLAVAQRGRHRVGCSTHAMGRSRFAGRLDESGRARRAVRASEGVRHAPGVERRGVRQSRRPASSGARPGQRGVRSRNGRPQQRGRRWLGDVAAAALARARQPFATDVDGDRSTRWPSSSRSPPRRAPDSSVRCVAASATVRSTVRLTSRCTIAASRAAYRVRCSRRSTTRTRASCRAPASWRSPTR